MSYNRVILMGRITHDLELRTTPSGVNVCQFSIAVDRRYQAKGEERKSDFFRVTVWRSTADFVTRYFKKGSMIMVEGELHNDNYTDKNGNTVYSVDIAAENVYFTGEKANNTQGGTGSYNNAGGYQQNGYNNGGYNNGNGYNQGNNYNQGNDGYRNPPQGGNGQNNGGNNGGVPDDFGGAGSDSYPF